MTHFFVALHKIKLIVQKVRLVLFFLRASNCIHLRNFALISNNK